MVKTFKRFVKHLLHPSWRLQFYFSKEDLSSIEKAVEASEAKHSGEIRVCIESALPLHRVILGNAPKKRAIEVFSDLHVWDTENNNGILIYLLLADHDFEILVDRGLKAYASKETLETIANQMEHEFKKGQFLAGVLKGIEELTQICATHYPDKPKNKNELSNKAVVK